MQWSVTSRKKGTRIVNNPAAKAFMRFAATLTIALSLPLHPIFRLFGRVGPFKSFEDGITWHTEGSFDKIRVSNHDIEKLLDSQH
jgi:hypothetical protein